MPSAGRAAYDDGHIPGARYARSRRRSGTPPERYGGPASAARPEAVRGNVERVGVSTATRRSSRTTTRAAQSPPACGGCCVGSGTNAAPCSTAASPPGKTHGRPSSKLRRVERLGATRSAARQSTPSSPPTTSPQRQRAGDLLVDAPGARRAIAASKSLSTRKQGTCRAPQPPVLRQRDVGRQVPAGYRAIRRAQHELLADRAPSESDRDVRLGRHRLSLATGHGGRRLRRAGASTPARGASGFAMPARPIRTGAAP